MKLRYLSILVFLLLLMPFPAGMPYLSISGIPEAQAVFNKVATLTAGSSENYAKGMIAYNGYLYVGARVTPNKILKIRLSDFTQVATLTLNSGYNLVDRVDRVGNFLYLACGTSPTKIAKVDLTTFTQVGGLTLNAGEDPITAIGHYGNVLYVGTWTWPTTIVRINVTTFTRIDSLTLNAGEDLAESIIPYGGYIHVGTYTTPAYIVRVRISDFTRYDRLSFGNGENRIEQSYLDGSTAYYSHYDSGGKFSKVNLSTFQKLGTITLSETNLTSVNVKDNYIFVGVYSTPAKVIKVDKTAFAEVSKLTFSTGENLNMHGAIDGNYLYLTLYVAPAKIVKIDINPQEYPPTINYFTPTDTTPEVAEGASLAFAHTSSDVDNDPLTYSWLLDSVEQATTQNWTYSPGYDDSGVHNVTLVVSDPRDLFDSQEWTVTVINVNRPPAIDSYFPLTDPVINEGELQEFNVTHSDPDGDTISVQWYLNGTPSVTVDSYTFVADYGSAGTYNVTVTVADDSSQTKHQWILEVVHVKLHDVAVTDATFFKTIIGKSFSMNVNVTVENQGEFTDTFTVTTYADNITIQALNVTDLPPGSSTTLIFTWNTTGFAMSYYTISAVANVIPIEIDTADNTFVGGDVKVGLVGDVNGDGEIDIYDLILMAICYGSNVPPAPYNVDVVQDDTIDIYDVLALAIHYGETEVAARHIGLVGWWSFDEEAGNLAKDSSEFGNDGAVYGATWVDGKYGKALSFDGSGQHVNVMESTDYEAFKYKGENMTIECWVKVSASETTGGTIVSKPWNSMTRYNYWIRWTSENKIVVMLGGDDHLHSYETTKTFAKEQYHYVVAVFDSARNVYLYVDGDLEISGTHDITVWTPLPEHYGDQNRPLAIAHLYPYGSIFEDDSGQTLIGIIDEVRIYNRALSAAEIQEYFH